MNSNKNKNNQKIIGMMTKMNYGSKMSLVATSFE